MAHHKEESPRAYLARTKDFGGAADTEPHIGSGILQRAEGRWLGPGKSRGDVCRTSALALLAPDF